MAYHNGKLGTISKNFRLEIDDFYEGGDLFQAAFPDFNRYSLEYYELNNIMEILSMYKIEEDFVSIPIFDALIANNDRHCDNWGVLNGVDGIRLAPIYDNGSSLGFNETSINKEKMLSDNRMLQGFCNRGRPSIGIYGKKKPKHIELLAFLRKNFPETTLMNFRRLEKLNVGILTNIVNNIPNKAIDDLNKKWVVHLILYRRDWLLNWFEGNV